MPDLTDIDGVIISCTVMTPDDTWAYYVGRLLLIYREKPFRSAQNLTHHLMPLFGLSVTLYSILHPCDVAIPKYLYTCHYENRAVRSPQAGRNVSQAGLCYAVLTNLLLLVGGTHIAKRAKNNDMLCGLFMPSAYGQSLTVERVGL